MDKIVNTHTRPNNARSPIFPVALSANGDAMNKTASSNDKNINPPRPDTIAGFFIEVLVLEPELGFGTGIEVVAPDVLSGPSEGTKVLAHALLNRSLLITSGGHSSDAIK